MSLLGKCVVFIWTQADELLLLREVAAQQPVSKDKVGSEFE